MEQCGAPTPMLPPEQQILQEEEVRTPPRTRTRSAGDDPSISAIALETFAVKAFGDMGQTARLRLIRDHFIAGHSSCELRRYLDSVSPETPMRDVVDRCRVWESPTDPEIRRVSKPGPEPGGDDQPAGSG